MIDIVNSYRFSFKLTNNIIFLFTNNHSPHFYLVSHPKKKTNQLCLMVSGTIRKDMVTKCQWNAEYTYHLWL